jgi:hypothetical protein
MAPGCLDALYQFLGGWLVFIYFPYVFIKRHNKLRSNILTIKHDKTKAFRHGFCLNVSFNHL